MSLFPIFLKLTGRPCTVIGAGPTQAESKIESLQAASASITRHRPRCKRRHRRDGRKRGEVTQHSQRVHVAATSPASSSSSRPRMFRRSIAPSSPTAEAGGVLINAVDDPPFCDFYFPSVVRRGDLQITAISTAGHSPALAQRLAQGDRRAAPASTPATGSAELGNLRREVLQLEPLNDARKGRTSAPVRQPRSLQLRRLSKPRPSPGKHARRPIPSQRRRNEPSYKSWIQRSRAWACVSSATSLSQRTSGDDLD